jgi:hypothetical protein
MRPGVTVPTVQYLLLRVVKGTYYKIITIRLLLNATVQLSILYW